MKLNKKIPALTQLLLVVTSLFAFSFLMSDRTIVSAADSDVSYCCEKISGENLWCLNAPEDSCDSNFLSAPTSCESTSYCQTGTCYDTAEGICMSGTPQRVCEENEDATWDPREVDDVPQCQLGCCLIADQAAFVTLTRCKSLSEQFGVDSNFRTDITDESTCIATANSQDKGACVYEQDFERVCEFTTREECGASATTEVITNEEEIEISSERKFYEGYLCSADVLATTCAAQVTTECYQGDVYWVDSCGNRENIFAGTSGSQLSLSYNDGKLLTNSETSGFAGSCDYLEGEKCSTINNVFSTASQQHECQATSCGVINGDEKLNGESWCVLPGEEGNNVYDDTSVYGLGEDRVGSRYFRQVCRDGEVITEPCSDYRNEICVDGVIETTNTNNPFTTAICRTNRWEDCTLQTYEDDCKNDAKRDCIWTNETLEGIALLGADDDGNTIGEGMCLPEFPPGLEFWEEGSAEEICGLATARCEVTVAEDTIAQYFGLKTISTSKGITNPEFIDEGDAISGDIACLDDDWFQQANQVCVSLGDCGASVNYVGEYSDSGARALSLDWDEDDAEWDDKIEELLVTEATRRPLTFALIAIITGRAVGGILPITGMATSFNYGGSTYTIKDESTIIRESDQREYTQNEDGEWGFEGTSGFIVLSESTGDVNTQSFFTQEIENYISSTDTTVPSDLLNLDNGDTAETEQDERLSQTNSISALQSLTNEGGDGATIKCETIMKMEYVVARHDDGEIINKEYCRKGCEGGKCIGGDDSADFNCEGNEWCYRSDYSCAMGSAVSCDSTSSCYSDRASCVAARDIAKEEFGENKSVDWGDALTVLVSAGAMATAGYFAGTVVSEFFGADASQSKALGLSLGAAAFTLSTFSGIEATSSTFLASPWFAAGVGVAVLALTYANEETEGKEFQCLPWQAPSGGDNCQICNDDDIPCSEYRCKSLGQNCELVNQGTEEELCVNTNPDDSNPPVIQPNEDALTPGFKYDDVVTSPPDEGFRITTENGDCLPAFTSIEFGIDIVDYETGEREPAQCKIDYESTDSYEEMLTYMGGSNLYKYNHTEKLLLPSASDLENSSLRIQNGEDMTFFIRCQDKSGNSNDAEYAVKFCVDPTPDTTAPEVLATSQEDNSCVAYQTTSTDVVFYTDEPAWCSWSFEDQDYDNMQYEMDCSRTAAGNGYFPCVANLTGITGNSETYYVRCEDDGQDGSGNRGDNTNNRMEESFELSLYQGLNLISKNAQPNGTEVIYGSVDPMPIELYIETSMGCNDGLATCYYSDTYRSNGANYVEFFDTYNQDGIHTQKLYLEEGDHDYYIRCLDEGGNVAEEEISFELDIDESAPIVVRVYEESGYLKILTLRDSECAYSFDSCDFDFEEGTEMPYANSTAHVSEWNSEKTFYIKCRDEYQSETSDCSIIVRPTRDFL